MGFSAIEDGDPEKSRSEVQLGKMSPAPSVATAIRARQARTVGNARCREAHKENAIRLPPGTISATAAYAASTRIGLEDWDSEFIDRSSIAAFRMSCAFRNTRSMLNYA
jgi:hypothetical protein